MALHMKKLPSCIPLISCLIFSSSCLAERPTALENEVQTPHPGTQQIPEAVYLPAHEKPTEKSHGHGNQLNMPATQTHNERPHIPQLDFPRRGTSQDRVQNELGRPIKIIPAIGQPPISQWIYNDRIVYFEYTSVIHVVAK